MQIVNPNRRRTGSSPKEETPITPGRKISAKLVDRYLRLVMFLAVIGMLYIWNSHRAEKQIRELNALEKDVKSLKSRYIIKEAALSAASQFSEISEVADTISLQKLVEPPYKLVKNTSDK